MTAIEIANHLYQNELKRWLALYVRAAAIGSTPVEYINQLHWDSPDYVDYEVTQ
jgi:hypothetical protein